MNLETLRAKLDYLRVLASRDACESAHELEDELFVEVLKAVAAGHPDAQALATEVLKSSEIEFARYRI